MPSNRDLLARAGLIAEFFATEPIEVYESLLTGRIVVVVRDTLGYTDPYFADIEPFRVTRDTENGNVIYFFEPKVND